MNPRRHRPEIDGLRAVAVVPVVLFHRCPAWLPGGFLGVDVFFVISGFLITTLVLDDLRSGAFSLRQFWARRIRRIVPALAVMIGCTLVAASVLLPRFDHAVIGRQAVAALLSVANLYVWRASGDYWGQQAEQMPLLHTWSLSVEEQFYLLLPLGVWGIWAWRPKWLTPLLGIVTAASFALFVWGTGRIGTFYLLPTRAWELGVGCGVASLLGHAGPTLPTGANEPTNGNRAARGNLSSWWAVLGLGMILAAYGCVSEMNAGSAVTVLGTALVLAFSHTGPSRAILSLPPLVAVGKISYSLYLWHWPFLVFAAHPNFEIDGWVAVGLSCVAAVVSYRWIEEPTRRRTGMLPAIAMGYALVVVAAIGMTYSRGTYDVSGFARPVTHAYAYNVADVAGEEYRRTVARAGATHDLPEPSFGHDAWHEGGIIVGSAARPRVVVMGDSHGTAWSAVIRNVVERFDVTTSFYSAIGVSPFGGFPWSPAVPQNAPYSEAAFQQARLAWIAQWRPDVVLLSARWSQYAPGDVHPLLRFLDAHAGRILLVEQPPELSIADRSPQQWLAYKKVVPEIGRQVWLSQGNRQRYERGRALVRQLAAEYHHCDVVPVYDLYATDSRVLVLDGRNLLYLDDDHLTDYGAELAAARITQAVARALADGVGVAEGGR